MRIQDSGHGLRDSLMPYFSTPSAGAVNGLEDRLDGFDAGVRGNPVSKVEDVAWPWRHRLQESGDGPDGVFRWAGHQVRIQIALQGNVCGEAGADPGEADGVVDGKGGGSGARQAGRIRGFALGE